MEVNSETINTYKAVIEKFATNIRSNAFDLQYTSGSSYTSTLDFSKELLKDITALSKIIGVATALQEYLTVQYESIIPIIPTENKES